MLGFEKLEIYLISMSISEKLWEIVSLWSDFEKDTIGKQIVRSADSVSANISEGYGRYHFKDSRNFFYYARGSLCETITWLKKAESRKLINDNDYLELYNQCIRLSVKLNNFIKAVGKRSDPQNTTF